MQLLPYFRAALLVSEEAQQQFDLPVMKQLNPDQRLRVGPVAARYRVNALTNKCGGLAKRLAEPQRGIPGLPLERAYLRVAFDVSGQQHIDPRMCLPLQREKGLQSADVGLTVSHERRDRLADRLLRFDRVGLRGSENALPHHPFDRVVVALRLNRRKGCRQAPARITQDKASYEGM